MRFAFVPPSRSVLAGVALAWLAGCATSAPSPDPTRSAPSTVAAPTGTLVVHRNAPGAPPSLCTVDLQAKSLKCDGVVGRFAGPVRGDLVVTEVVEDDEGHRERLVRWSGLALDPVPLTPWTGRVRHPRWSADGQHVFAVSDANGGSDLYRISAGSKAPPALLSPHPAGTYEPDPHPHGTSVVVASSRRGNADLYLLRLHGPETLQPLTTDPADDLRPRWSPDGSRVAFLSDRTGLRRVHTVQPAGAPRVLVPPLDDPQVDLHWAPTGTTLAIVTGPTPDRTRIEIVDGHSGERFTTIGGAEWAVQQPTWSPDGDWLAFTCTRAGALPSVCIASVTDGTISLIAEHPTEEIWLPRWWR